jgi:hypothetical protein
LEDCTLIFAKFLIASFPHWLVNRRVVSLIGDMRVK